MDPISAVGAVASVLQLAGTALSLSKTLYEVSSALSNATEDICALAHDLTLFSQSLTLLSRMLEASKESYGEGIYVLTAKIIVDCGAICEKIEKVIKKLQKKGGLGGKLKWMISEKKIKALLERLRDMKLTLLMILSHLQLDKQLSLMNISSASTIECSTGETRSPRNYVTNTAGSKFWTKSEPAVPVDLTSSPTSSRQNPTQSVSVDGNAPTIPSGDTGPERDLRPAGSVESFRTALSVQPPNENLDITPVLVAQHFCDSHALSRHMEYCIGSEPGGVAGGFEIPGLVSSSMSLNNEHVGDNLPQAAMENVGETHEYTGILPSSPFYGEEEDEEESEEGVSSSSFAYLHRTLHDLPDRECDYSENAAQLQRAALRHWQATRRAEIGHAAMRQDDEILDDTSQIFEGITRPRMRPVNPPQLLQAGQWQQQVPISWTPIENVFRDSNQSEYKAPKIQIDSAFNEIPPSKSPINETEVFDPKIEISPSYEIEGPGSKRITSSQLWWTAYTMWSTEYPEGNRHIYLPFLLKSNNLWPQSDETSPEEWNRCITEFCTQYGLFKDTDSRFAEVVGVLKIVSESIGFGTANVAWAGLAYVTSLETHYDRCFRDSPSHVKDLFDNGLANVASIIARYTVMENIFCGWTGMTLKAEYEAELIDLCVQVIDYLDEATSNLLDHCSSMAGLNAKTLRILNADKKCRSFTVLIDDGAVRREPKDVEEISSDDDSDEAPNLFPQ